MREGFRRWQTEQARVDVDRAKTALSASEIVVSEAEIRAPEDGIVLHRLAEPGQLLGVGQPAVTMAFANRLYVRTFVPEPRLGHVKQGQAVSVRVDAFPGRTFPAHITEISPDAEFTPKAVETRAERVNLVYAAKADLDDGWNAPLVPGQPAEVVVELERRRRPADRACGGQNSSDGGLSPVTPMACGLLPSDLRRVTAACFARRARSMIASTRHWMDIDRAGCGRRSHAT